MIGRASALLALGICALTGVTCAVKRVQLERGLDSLEHRKSLILRVVRPYGTGRESVLLNGKEAAMPYVRLLRSPARKPWEGTRDQYPDTTIFRLEFYELPPYRREDVPFDDLVHLMDVNVHPMGKVIIEEGGAPPTFLHQVTKDAYDEILVRFERLPWKQMAPPN